jgi:hypothetical protein
VGSAASRRAETGHSAACLIGVLGQVACSKDHLHMYLARAHLFKALARQVGRPYILINCAVSTSLAATAGRGTAVTHAQGFPIQLPPRLDVQHLVQALLPTLVTVKQPTSAAAALATRETPKLNFRKWTLGDLSMPQVPQTHSLGPNRHRNPYCFLPPELPWGSLLPCCFIQGTAVLNVKCPTDVESFLHYKLNAIFD